MKNYALAAACLATLIAPARAQETKASELKVSHPDCSFFGPQRERFLPRSATRSGLDDITRKVLSTMPAPASIPSIPGGSRTYGKPRANLIDKEIFRVLQDKGVAPAE